MTFFLQEINELFLELLLLIIRLCFWLIAIAASKIVNIVGRIFFWSAFALGLTFYFFYWLLSFISFWSCVALFPLYRRIFDTNLEQANVLLHNSVLGSLYVGVEEEKQEIIAMVYISPGHSIFWEWYAVDEDEEKPQKRQRKQTLKPDRRLTDEERKLYFERVQEIFPMKPKKAWKFMPKKKPNQGKAPSAIRKTKKSVRL